MSPSPLFLHFLLLVVPARRAASQEPEIAPITFTIHEEVALRTAVGDPAAKARLRHRYALDFPTFTYAILTGERVQYFKLKSQRNATLFVARPIDRESLCSEGYTSCCRDASSECRIELEVNVNCNSMTRLALTVIIVVLDINDNGCRFKPSTANVKFLENDVSGKEMLPSPVDPDSDFGIDLRRVKLRPSDPRFRLDVSMSPFSRRKVRLQLRLVEALDRERTEQVWLTVVADDGVAEHECQLRVNVSVLDRNDNKPIFLHTVYNRTVNETDAVPVDVLRLTAYDRDEGPNARISYSLDRMALSEATRTLFHLSKDTGIISLVQPLRYDRLTPRHQLLVFATDHGEVAKTGTATVNIVVKDINNNPPKLKVRNPKGGNLIEVPEEAQSPLGVAVIVVTDDDVGDNAKTKCSLGSTSKFTLREMTGNTYQVLTTTVFDREQSPTERFRIICHDSGVPKRSVVQQVSVRIRDINDNAPHFLSPIYNVWVTEDSDPLRFPQYTVVKVTARDPDEYGSPNSEIRYSLGYVPLNKDKKVIFKMNSRTGLIQSTGVLDREERQMYNFTVLASDKGYPKRTGTATVTVRLRDYNDHAPKFSSIHYNCYLRENIPVNSLVETIVVYDHDVGRNGNLTFYLRYDEGPQSLPFRLLASDRVNERYNVKVLTTKPIDREELVSSDRNHRTSVSPVYKFFVIARDMGEDRSLSAKTEVSVHITDENDEAPRFSNPPGNHSRVSVSYRERVGKEVIQIFAYDRDAGENGSLAYSLHKGNQMGYFTIDPKGMIRLARRLPETAVGHYTVEVVVSDRGINPMTATINVDITVDTSIPTTPQRSNRKLSTRAINLYIIIAIVASSFVVSLVLLAVICFIMRRNKRRRQREGEPFAKTDCSGLSTNLSERSVSNLVQRSDQVHLQNHRPPPPYQSVPVDDPRTPDHPPLSFTDGHAVEIISKPKSDRFAYTPLVSSFESPSFRPRAHADCIPVVSLPVSSCNGFTVSSKTTSIDRKRPVPRAVTSVATAGMLDKDGLVTTLPRDLHRLADTFI